MSKPAFTSSKELLAEAMKEHGLSAIQPEANFFPLLPIGSTDFSNLYQSILVEGLIDEIVVSDDAKTLIDGRNRLAICHATQVKPRFIAWGTFKKKVKHESPAEWIMATNFARRHLTEEQKALAVVSAELAEQERQQAEAKGKKSEEGGQSGKTRKVLAEKAGVSTYKIQVATALKKMADSGNENAVTLYERIMEGTGKLKDAAELCGLAKKSKASESDDIGEPLEGLLSDPIKIQDSIEGKIEILKSQVHPDHLQMALMWLAAKALEETPFKELAKELTNTATKAPKAESARPTTKKASKKGGK